MKIFSDEIITPEKQMEAIKIAFEAQNMFFMEQIRSQIKPLKIAIWFLIGLNITFVGTFLFSFFM